MNRIGAFLLGGTIGALAALAFAPQSGEKTRTLVFERAGSLTEDVRDKAGSLVGGAKGTPAAANDASADELREKIEAARKRIAEQAAKNAEAAQ